VDKGRLPSRICGLTLLPSYLNKSQEKKFWEVQIEEVKDGDRNCYFHIFDCPKKAAAFASRNNVWFNAKSFYFSTVEKESQRRATKHF
jgi:hypothetical protein